MCPQCRGNRVIRAFRARPDRHRDRRPQPARTDTPEVVRRSVAPEMVTSAAGDLDGIRSALSAANAAAAPPTTGVAAPGTDQVSAAITAVLGIHAQEYQAVSAQVAEFHDQFVGALNAGAGQYLTTEAANVEQYLLDAVNAPAKALLGHELTGFEADGADGGTGSPGHRVAAASALLHTPPMQ